MARLQATGLVLQNDGFEWTTLRRVKDRIEVVGARRVKPAAAEGEEEADAAVRALQESGPLETPVGVGVPSRDVLLRVVRLPAADEEELSGMVALQLDKFSPFPVEQMVSAWEVLRREEKAWTVLIGAARKDAADGLGDRLGKAGVLPARVDAVLLGWWRLLQDRGDVPEQGRHVVVLLEPEAGPEILVFDDGVPVAFRSVGEGEAARGEDFVAETVREVGFTLMSLELDHGAGAGTIAVWSRGAAPRELAAALREDYDCEVALKSLNDLPPVSEGLARRELEAGSGAFDLTPESWRTREERQRFKRRVLSACAWIAGAWVLAVAVVVGGLYRERSVLARLERERDRTRGPALEVREMRRRVYMVDRYMDRSRSALECLRVVSELLPEGVDLTSFTYRKEEQVRVSGEATSVNLIYELKDGLDAANVFPKTTLQGPIHDRRKNKEVFDIEMKLPGGVS